jgi:hypothetical protein
MIINYRKIIFKHERIIMPKDVSDVQVVSFLLSSNFPMGTKGRGSRVLEGTSIPTEYREQLNIQDSTYDANARWKRLCLCR